MFNFRTSGRRRLANRLEDGDFRPDQEIVEEGDRAVEVTHEAAGHAQEVIRAQLADLSQRHLILRQAGETVEALERSVMQLLSDHQRTRFMADGSRSELESEREQHARLRQEFSRLQVETHGHKQARLQLETSLDNHQHRVNDLASELAETRRESSASHADTVQLRSDLSEALGRAGDAEEKIAFYRERYDERQSELVNLEVALKKELQQSAVLTEETRSVQESLDHLNRNLARRDREYAAAQAALEQAAERRQELEHALAELDRKHNATDEELREALETTRAASGSTRNKLEAMSSRLQITENLLAQAREEISTRTEEHSSLQRQILQINLERTSLEKRVEETRRERDRADRLAKETSDINARLAERSHSLVANLKAREREHEVARQKLITTAEELTRANELMRTLEQQFQGHVSELNSQVAHERSSRQMADGSLEAARSTIDALRREIARLRHTNPGDAVSDDAAENAPRMPIAARLITGDDGEASQMGDVVASIVLDGTADPEPVTPRPAKALSNASGRKNGARAPAVVIVRAEESERAN